MQFCDCVNVWMCESGKMWMYDMRMGECGNIRMYEFAKYGYALSECALMWMWNCTNVRIFTCANVQICECCKV